MAPDSSAGHGIDQMGRQQRQHHAGQSDDQLAQRALEENDGCREEQQQRCGGQVEERDEPQVEPSAEDVVEGVAVAERAAEVVGREGEQQQRDGSRQPRGGQHPGGRDAEDGDGDAAVRGEESVADRDASRQQACPQQRDEFEHAAPRGGCRLEAEEGAAELCCRHELVCSRCGGDACGDACKQERQKRRYDGHSCDVEIHRSELRATCGGCGFPGVSGCVPRFRDLRPGGLQLRGWRELRFITGCSSSPRRFVRSRSAPDKISEKARTGLNYS